MHLKVPEYISPSALAFYEKNADEYYIRYCCTDRPDRESQNQAMASGSAFDAFAKSYIYYNLFGKYDHYALDEIFEKQVEQHLWDWARPVGKQLFDIYTSSGALANLMLELNQAIGTPRFEFEIRNAIETVDRQAHGITLLGKPDVFFINSEGAHVLHDWKVNGYCSQWGASPMQGYIRLLPDGKMHKDCMPMRYKGMMINGASYMEMLNKGWADQLATYTWLMGEDIGSESIVSVDQVVCKMGTYKIASHRSRVSFKYQHSLLERYRGLWDRLHSDYFFRELSHEDSIKKCVLLQERAKTLRGDGSERDKWFADVV